MPPPSSPSDSSIGGLIHHHISTGSVCVPDKDHSVSNTVYICTSASGYGTTCMNTDYDTMNRGSSGSSQYEQLLNDMVYIHWDQYRLDIVQCMILINHLLSKCHNFKINSTCSYIYIFTHICSCAMYSIHSNILCINLYFSFLFQP